MEDQIISLVHFNLLLWYHLDMDFLIGGACCAEGRIPLSIPRMQQRKHMPQHKSACQLRVTLGLAEALCHMPTTGII